jgi:hypothetical protein
MHEVRLAPIATMRLRRIGSQGNECRQPASCLGILDCGSSRGFGVAKQGSGGSMPFYHFDLTNSDSIARDRYVELPGDIEAMDSADVIARQLVSDHPELRNQNYAVLVTNEEGDEICRVPLDVLH